MALLMSPTLFLRNVEKNIRILKGAKQRQKILQEVQVSVSTVSKNFVSDYGCLTNLSSCKLWVSTFKVLLFN